MRDPLDTAQDDARTAEETKQAERRRKQQIEDIKWLMAHAQGRRFICRLLEETGVHRTSFHVSGSTAAHNEGRKHVGYVLIGELMEFTPELYVRLLKEYQREN